MLRLRTIVIAASMGLVTACGGGGSTSLSDLSDAYRSAMCDYYVRCGVVESQALCEQLLGGLETAELEAAVAAGKVKYDGDAAGECLDAIGGRSCNPGDENARVAPAACDNMIKGTVADGGQCFNSGECVSGSCTLTDCTDACCPGTCDPTVAEAAIGASCATADCVDGAFCNAQNTCEALKASGATCTSSSECAYGTRCLGTPQTCQAPPAKGAACVVTNGTPTCGTTGLVCDASMKCVGYLFTGATCDPAADLCAPYLTCDETTMKCTGEPAIGEACTFGCQRGAYCDTTTMKCVATQANGATCQGDDECTSNYCDTTTMKCADPAVCI